MRNTFTKSERLFKTTEIKQLFNDNKSFTVYPFKVVYKIKKLEDVPVKFAISIPKKTHSKAVDRNLLKRRVREAYRCNNQSLKKSMQLSNTSIHLFLIYLSAEILSYKEIEDKIILLLQRLATVDGKITE